jgi:hypothetical protein
MKTYVSDKQISLVGRVWEIRRYLKMAQRKLSKDTSLLTYLSEQTEYSPAQPRSLAFDGRINKVSSANSPKPYPQQLLFLQNKQDPYVSPSPLLK